MKMATRGLSRQTRVTKRPPHTVNKDGGTPSPRHGRRGSVTFEHQTSVYAENSESQERQGVLKGTEEEEEVEQRPGRRSCYGCHFLVENKVARRLFRVCAVVNLISLVFSAPLLVCNPEEGEKEDCKDVFIQLVFVTILDFLLALIYTIHTYIRFQYSLYLYHQRKKKQVSASHLHES